MNIELLNRYRTQMGENAFWKYVQRVYRKATLMHSNESFAISDVCEKETEPLFRDLLTAIIHMHPGEYLFSDDYSRFKKTDTDGLAAARKIRENAYRIDDNQRDGATPTSAGIRSEVIYPQRENLPNKKPVSQSGIRSSKTQICAS